MTKVMLVGMYDIGNVSLAPHVLRAYTEQFSISPKLEDIVIKEFSIFDNPVKSAVQFIKKENPDVIGFSAYVWNINEVLEISKQITGKVILGGPQVTGIEKDILNKNLGVDIIVTGEGEIPFKELLEHFIGLRKLKDVHGITTRDFQTAPQGIMELSAIPQIYDKLFKENPNITEVNFETSRGCPFGCRFCTWAGRRKGEGRVMRYYPLDKVKQDLDIILGNDKIKSIYICDSSLLVNKERAKEILKYIIDKRGDVLVRYEFNAEHLDDELIDLMAQLPNNEFNFGIQSTNPKALRAMNRLFNKKTFEEKYNKVLSKKTPILSFDLIYGLPGDDIEGYKTSLNYVMSIDTKGKLEKIITNPLIVLPGSEFFRDKDKWEIKLNDEKRFIIKSNSTFSEEDIDLARRYSFFVSTIYLNRVLTNVIKTMAEQRDERYIDLITQFMESLPFDLSRGAYPDVVPSFKEHYEHRNRVFREVISKYDELVEAFREFSNHKFDNQLKDYKNHYAAKFYKLIKFSGLEVK